MRRGSVSTNCSFEILGYDPTLEPKSVHRQYGVELVELDQLLRRSEIVSLHAPLIPATTGMLGPEQLVLMRDGATIVNTARAGLLATSALETELISGRLFAILDVTDPEPLPASSPYGACRTCSLRRISPALSVLRSSVSGRRCSTRSSATSKDVLRRTPAHWAELGLRA